MDCELELATDVTMPAAQVACQFGHVSSMPYVSWVQDEVVKTIKHCRSSCVLIKRSSRLITKAYCWLHLPEQLPLRLYFQHWHSQAPTGSTMLMAYHTVSEIPASDYLLMSNSLALQ